MRLGQRFETTIASSDSDESWVQRSDSDEKEEGEKLSLGRGENAPTEGRGDTLTKEREKENGWRAAATAAAMRKPEQGKTLAEQRQK